MKQLLNKFVVFIKGERVDGEFVNLNEPQGKNITYPNQQLSLYEWCKEYKVSSQYDKKPIHI